MNYYDNNKYNEYHDSFYIPKKDNTFQEKRIKGKSPNKKKIPIKKIIILLIFILLVVLLFVIGNVFFSSPEKLKIKFKNKERYLENIRIQHRKNIGPYLQLLRVKNRAWQNYNCQARIVTYEFFI